MIEEHLSKPISLLEPTPDKYCLYFFRKPVWPTVLCSGSGKEDAWKRCEAYDHCFPPACSHDIVDIVETENTGKVVVLSLRCQNCGRAGKVQIDALDIQWDG